MPKLTPWLDIPSDSDFSIHNLPFGIFSLPEAGKGKRVGMAIGNYVVDVADAAEEGLFEEMQFDYGVLKSNDLNGLIALGKEVTGRIRLTVQQALCDECSVLRNIGGLLAAMDEVTLHVPIKAGDYTDFYSSREHAFNVGKLFRDPDNALLPNWKHLPVGYHGRASSIVISGSEIYRPNGQIVPDGQNHPVFSPSQKLDFELEMAFVIGKETRRGRPVSVDTAEEHIFGMALFNDWSARDIQKWEYQPLGPFLGKSFSSTISPWIVPMEALEPFKMDGPEQHPAPLAYLRDEGKNHYDINLQAAIQPDGGEEKVVCNTNHRYLYWSMAQQVAHHTSNGCNLNVGDLMASGTISGPDPGSLGCLLEITENGSRPVTLGNGEQRSWLQDGDSVILRGYAESEDGIRVGFGECKGKIIAKV
ncbi:fumarylacetoacetase [Rhodohalobacter mucosus]|uniref:fumarylacetoacetase n=1 Tax=Rhodohalobacter mucosus TaxID=2079485 RepID=A0A316TPU2_9BACT|nr:fumarylacetoacetase [Rhodohalobacter mucosus]PWN06643.1 fumarylacetoacetase [Rhodohalobacter mucosus]